MKLQYGLGILASLVLSVSPAWAESPTLTQMFPVLNGINLTPAQQVQLTSLSHQTLPQVQAILTPEQQTQFEASLAQGQGVGNSLLSLDLSRSQQLKLRKIMKSARSQITETLTPEQQQQIQQNVQNLQQR
jgi:Spy/CpxP family protein refolding chaperone